MISYFHQNKGKFIVCEDSLTSITFDLLKYLPNEIFWNILKGSLFYNKLPKVSGEILKLNLWSKWGAEETDNKRYIEPDVFIRFSDFDVIVEAKRYNRNQQNNFQINREIQAYFNEFQEDEKDLYLIQLGGLLDINDVQIDAKDDRKVVVCKSDWTRLLDQIVNERKKISTLNYSQINSYKRIFDDLIRGFEMHGFFKKLWLDDMKRVTIKEDNFKNIFRYESRY